MLSKRIAISFPLLLGIVLAQFAAQSGQAQTQAPAGHGIKCLKADGSPCGNPEVSDLNKDIADFKATFGDAKSTVGDAQQNVADAKRLSTTKTAWCP